MGHFLAAFWGCVVGSMLAEIYFFWKRKRKV